MRASRIEAAKLFAWVKAKAANTIAVLCLVASSPSAFAFTVTAFQPDVWPRTDAQLGINGWVIENFEDATLVNGVTVTLNNTTSGFPAASVLPSGAFNPLTNDPNAAHAFASGTWDGSGTLINRHFSLSPLPAAYQDFDFGDLTFNFSTGVRGVGFSVQGVEFATPILVNGLQIGRVGDFLTPDTATGRNGYLRIDAALGEVIYSVTLRRGVDATRSDGFVVDHVAFKAASLVQVVWKARVDTLNVVNGVSPFGAVAEGDIISGRLVYDAAATGSPAPSEGTNYLGSIVSSTALIGTSSFTAGTTSNQIEVVNDGAQFGGDVLNYDVSGPNGAINGAGPAAVSLGLQVGYPDGSGDAIDNESLPARAPSLGAFSAAFMTVDATSGTGSATITSQLVAIQSQPYRNPDRDGDGIANIIEMQLGLNPDNPSDGAGDLDADGFSNVREIRAGSDPSSATSVPRRGYFRLSSVSMNFDKGDAFIPIDVQRFGGDLGAASVEFRTQDRDARAGVDYQAVDQTLTWADGELGPKRVNVPLILRPGADATQTLKFQLVNPSPGTEIAVPEAIVFIANDTYDAQGLPFAGFVDEDQFEVRAAESSGQLETFVNRRGNPDGEISVDYALTLPASAAGDAGSLRELAGSLVWADGDASVKSITIPIYDDLVTDPRLDIVLRLEHPTGNAYLGSIGGVFTIDDEDVFWRQADSVGFATRGVRYQENEGVARIPVLRTGPSSNLPLTVTVNLVAPPNPPLVGRAAPGVDFDGTVFPQTVSWGSNDTAVKEVVVPLLDDAGVDDAIKSFTTFLIGPTGTRDPASGVVIFDNLSDFDIAQDTDGDGVLDVADIDNDKDGVVDAVDKFSLDPSESADLDGDGIGDNTDTDTDGDGVGNAIETLLGRNPLSTSDTQADFDGDGASDASEVASGSDPQSNTSVPGTGFIELSTLNLLASEDSRSVVIDVQRVRGSVGPLAVQLTTENIQAIAGVDYTGVNQTLSWASGDTTPRRVLIPLIDNKTVNGDRTFKVKLTAGAGTSPDQVMVNETRVLILDDDFNAQSAPFAGFVSVREADLRVRESAGAATVYVDRRGSLSGTMSVAYVVVPDGSTPGVDFVPRAGILTWTDGASEPKPIIIPIIDDLDIEGTEAFSLQLFSLSPNGQVDFGETYVQIVDDELIRQADVVTAASLEPVYNETDGTVRLSLFRLGTGTQAATVNVAHTDIEATEGADYTAITQQVNWAAGEHGSKPITFTVLDDAVAEPVEGFEIRLSSTTPGLSVDSAPIGVFIVDPEDVDLISDADHDGIVDFADLDDDNDNVNDFADAFPNDPARSAPDSDGDGVDDNVDAFPFDPTETVDTDHDGIGDNRDTDDDNDGIADAVENAYPTFLSRTNPADAALDFDGDGISNLRETRAGYRPDSASSVPDAGYLSFTNTGISAEDSEGSVSVEVRRLRGDVGALSVTLQTFDGSAKNGRDYSGVTQILTWGDGDMSPRTVNIPLIETPERVWGQLFRVRLQPSANERILIDELRVGIRDHDLEFTGTAFGGILKNGSDGTRVPESAGQAVIHIARQGSAQGVATVDYVVEPAFGNVSTQPTAGVDYAPTSGTLVWANGDRAPKPIVIPIFDDATIETTESLFVHFSNASDDVALEADTYVQIVDDEIVQRPNVIEQTTFFSYVEEQEPSARVRFLRSGNGIGAATLQIGFTATLPNPVATAGQDFNGTPQTLTWAAGETGIRDLVIPIFDDVVSEGYELIPVSIVGASGQGLSVPIDYYPIPVVLDSEDWDRTTDSDGDGAADLFIDMDDDNDLILDFNDPFPLDPTNTPPDAIPQATDDSIVVPAGGALSGINVLANDLNLTNTPLTVAIVSLPVGGTVAVNANNTVTYTTLAGFFGADSFVYSVTDADGDLDTATVTVFVDATPVAVTDAAEVFVGGSVVITVLANDSGLGNGGITVSINSQPAHGTLTVNGDNTLTYRPNAGFAGSDSASYRITDSDGDGATGSLTLFADDAPVAHNDNAGETVVNTPLLGINVLQNDTGLGNGPVTVALQGTPHNALVRVNADNTLDYLPIPGFSGVDTFRYRVTDADGDLSTGLVTTTVSSASGIPGQNVNVIGLTPNDPLYVPDTGLRQQNESQCAFQPDNQLRVFCVFNDYRGVNLTGDSWIGASMTRDGGSNWFSRLTPHFNQYPAYTAPTAPPPLKGLGLGFAADPVIASVPGGMLVGFIAANREEDGAGGLYLQRWFEQNSEIAFPWQPQVEPIVVDSGGEERFVDKDHMILTLAPATSANDTVTVRGTLEDGTAVTRQWPRGDVTFAYTVFHGPEEAEVLDFEEFEVGPLAGQDEWEVDGDIDAVTIDAAPQRETHAVRINTVGLTGETTARIPMMPTGNTMGAQIAFEFQLTTVADRPNGTFVIETPFANLEIHDGAIGVQGGDATHALPIPAGEWLSLVLFADPISRTFNVTVGDHGTLVDQPFSAASSTEIAIRAAGAADDALFIDTLILQVATNSDIMVRQSSDYGDTWRAPITLTPHGESATANQGVYLASRGDNMLAVWRRIDDPLNLDPAQTDAIMYATSADRGRSWGAETVLANICPFDQTGETDRFRTIAFPTAVATSTGFMVVWSDRGYAQGTSGAIECEAGPARVVMTQQAPDGHWTTPASIDPIPAGGRQFGHQFMPAINVAQDQVQVAWYDSRSDESGSFTQFIDDEADVANGDPLLLRHTLEVRSVRLVDGRPVGPSMRVTQFQQGVTPDDPTKLVQFERFYANGRLFRQGATPFLGDYMGVAAQANRQSPNGTWISNQFKDPTNPNAREPSFFVSWTDNRDVRGDVWRDLSEPTQYAPVTVAGGSAADGEPDAPNEAAMCVPGTVAGEDLALTRNQNVYGSMIRPGLQMSVPTPGKPISDIQRGFVVYLQNFTSVEHRYRVTILNQPVNGRASFLQLPLPPTSVPPLTQADVVVPPRSGIAKTVFLVSADPVGNANSRVDIQVVEEDCTDCQSDRVVLNGDELANDFANPGLRFDAVAAEIRTPTIAAPTVTVSTPGLRFPGLRFPGLRFPGLDFPGLRFPDLMFPGLRFPGLRFPDLQAPGLRFPGLRFDAVGDGTPQPVDFEDRVEVSPDALDDAGSQNAALVDAAEDRQMTEIVWPVTNEGNVVGAFDLQPFINADLSNAESQLLVVRSYVTNTIQECTLIPQINQEVVINIANPDLTGRDSDVKMFIAPGETLLVILRIFEKVIPGAPEPDPIVKIDPTDAAIAVRADACDTEQVHCDPASDDPALRPPTAVHGAHPVDAVFARLNVAGVSLTADRPVLDRRSGLMVSNITVTNRSAHPLIGQLRAEITANKPPTQQDGIAAGGKPYLLLLPNANSILGVGQSVTRTIAFKNDRPAPVFSAELWLKSVTAP